MSDLLCSTNEDFQEDLLQWAAPSQWDFIFALMLGCFREASQLLRYCHSAAISAPTHLLLNESSAFHAQLSRQAQHISLPVSKQSVDLLGYLQTMLWELVSVCCEGCTGIPKATYSWASGPPLPSGHCLSWNSFSAFHLSFVAIGLRGYLFCFYLLVFTIVEMSWCDCQYQSSHVFVRFALLARNDLFWYIKPGFWASAKHQPDLSGNFQEFLRAGKEVMKYPCSQVLPLPSKSLCLRHICVCA